MSGVPSYLRRTEDLKRLKTRALYLQGEDGSIPGPNTIPHFNLAGALDFTNVKIVDGGGSVDIPGDLTVGGDTVLGGNLTVDGVISGFIDTSAGMFETLSVEAATIQDLSANSIWTNTETVASRLDICGSAAVLGGLSIGQAHGIHELDVTGHVFIDSDGSAARAFTVPGIYTFAVPSSIGTISFEMIGAGGSPGFPGAIGGGGGYMQGTITGVAGKTLTVQVGWLGLGGTNPSSASYITIPGSGPLYAIAGAGGNGGGASGAINGGFGGGGTFYAFGAGQVANGGDGVDSGSIPGSRGRGGSSVGGTGGTGGIAPGSAGANPSGSFIDAVGGASNGGGSGGGGFAGGGGGASSGAPTGGGGGGSSFYNSSITTVAISYAGNALPAGVLPGYGRSGQGGYVSISYTGQPSLQTTGDIVCGGNLDVCGSITSNLTLTQSIFYKTSNYRIPYKILIASGTNASITSGVPIIINFSALSAPFNNLSKVKIDINGALVSPTALSLYLNWRINGTTPIRPLVQNVSATNPTLFKAKHSFELSSYSLYPSNLLNYGSYEAVDPVASLTGSGQYHPTNITLTGTVIQSLELSTSAGISAVITYHVYAYV